MAEPRKSVVSIGIKRLLNTAQYENLEVKLETQEEVTWSTLEERDKKIDSLTKLLNAKYLDVQSKVLGDLGLQEKVAWRPGATRAAAPTVATKPTSVGDELLA